MQITSSTSSKTLPQVRKGKKYPSSSRLATGYTAVSLSKLNSFGENGKWRQSWESLQFNPLPGLFSLSGTPEGAGNTWVWERELQKKIRKEGINLIFHYTVQHKMYSSFSELRSLCHVGWLLQPTYHSSSYFQKPGLESRSANLFSLFAFRYFGCTLFSFRSLGVYRRWRRPTQKQHQWCMQVYVPGSSSAYISLAGHHAT